MKEIFILANGLNGNELRRSLAKRGINSLGYQIASSEKLAKIALQRCGIAINKRQVNNIEQAAIVYSFLNEIKYFENASYTDALNLVKIFHTMRSCIFSGDVLDQIRINLQTENFKSKNAAIEEAYIRYSNFLYQNDLTDSDEIIYDALNHAKPFDAEFIYLEEFNYSLVEMELLNVVSSGNAKAKSICDIYGIKPSKFDNAKVCKAYGAINELEDVIEDIYKNHKLDECVIACTNEKLYSQLIYNLSLQYKLPVSFGCGISINNSNPAKLLKALVYWDNLGYNGVEALYDLLSCEALDWRFLAPVIEYKDEVNDKFIRDLSEYVGNLKLSTDEKQNSEKLLRIKDKNEMFEYARKLAKVFERGIIDFLKTFVLIRDGMAIDEVSLDSILENIKIFEKYNPGKLMNEVIPKITSANICNNISQEGKIHVTNLEGLMAVPRKYVYLCGFSANEFPGFAKENYLLLDSDLENFEGSINSEDWILNKVKLFEKTLSFINSASADIKISYSYYDLVELKEQNASSVLYKLVDNFDECRSVNYFDSDLSKSRFICRKYKDGVEVNYDIDVNKPLTTENLFERAWSYSDIDTYLNCPRKFYLKYVLKIPEVEVVDPFEILNAREIGTLAHKMMQLSGSKNINKTEFLEHCSKTFDEFLISKPALIESKKDNLKLEFLGMMSLAFDMDKSNSREVIYSEKNINAFHEKTGLKLKGFPDRIEKDGDLNIVVDFKTGREIEHKDNDATSCLQVLIYAYLFESENPNTKISRGEFRYLRNSGIVPCAYNEETKAKMDELLEEFASGLKSNNFERCTKKCEFCTYKDICLWPGEIDDEEEGSDD